MRSRRIASTAIAALVATGVVAGATAKPAVAVRPGPQPMTTWLAAVAAEERSWVGIAWTTGRKICDAAVTVVGDDLRIGYPASTGTYTSFSQGTELTPRHPDYTAFTVRPRAGENPFRRVEATLSYHTCGRHAVEKAAIFRLTLTVLPATEATR